MTVVRSLTTNLDFNVDFRPLNRFNQALSNFNLKFALGGAAVAAFAGKVVGAINDVSNLILDTEDLSKRTGIAFDDIIKLTKAAEQFRISPTQFQGALAGLNKDVLDAQRGFGRLYEIMRDNPNIRIRNDDGSLKNTEQVLESIVSAINQIADPQLRIQAFEDILKIDGVRLSAAFKDGYAAFKQVGETFDAQAKALKEQKAFAEQYTKDLKAISDSFTAVIQAFVTNFAPVILALTDSLNLLIQFYGKVLEQASKGPKGVASSGIFGVLPAAAVGAYDYLTGSTPPAAPGMNMTANIDINVAPGTADEQVQQISERTVQSLESFYGPLIRQIMNNNPQVE
jgi:hypothetical protein